MPAVVVRQLKNHDPGSVTLFKLEVDQTQHAPSRIMKIPYRQQTIVGERRSQTAVFRLCDQLEATIANLLMILLLRVAARSGLLM